MSRYQLSVAFSGAVDAESGVISGVSVITEGDALGHGVKIDSESLRTVLECAAGYTGGLKVKMNHHSGADAIIGSLKNFRIDGIQLRADLHLLRAHPMRALVLEMAETMPDSFGLSISFSGTVDEVYEHKFVRCLEIYSCDIVDQPAANPSGLFARVDIKEEVIMPDPSLEFSVVLGERDTARAQAQANFAALQTAIAERDALAADVANLTSQLGVTAKEFQAYKDAETERLNAEAAQIVAASGHAPVAVSAELSASTAPKTKDALWAEYHALKSPQERTAFYNTNRGQMKD